MRQFIKKLVFFLVPITLILFSGVFLPTTPRASKSLLFANKQKDSLLEHTQDPRIIFVGGSNLSFGLNSHMLKDSLALNPINTAVHASIGVKYMLENTLQYIRKEDVVILVFEYEHFYKSYNATSDDLLRTIFDVSPEKRKFLSFQQKINLLEYIPKYTLSKFKPSEYWGFKDSDVYSVNSFNKYGDVDAHWDLENRDYQPTIISGSINKDIIIKIKEFETVATQKGASVYLSFPSLDEVSFVNSKESISLIEKTLIANNFKILGNAKRYAMPENRMFNSTYHLNKEGVAYRTELFIEDYKKFISAK